MRAAVLVKLLSAALIAGASAVGAATGGGGAPGSAADSQYHPGHPCRSGSRGPSADKCPCPMVNQDGSYNTGGPCPDHPGCGNGEIKGSTGGPHATFVCCPEDSTTFRLYSNATGQGVLCSNNGGHTVEGRVV
jgi:hypothetical protein